MCALSMTWRDVTWFRIERYEACSWASMPLVGSGISFEREEEERCHSLGHIIYCMERQIRVRVSKVIIPISVHWTHLHTCTRSRSRKPFSQRQIKASILRPVRITACVPSTQPPPKTPSQGKNMHHSSSKLDCHSHCTHRLGPRPRSLPFPGKLNLCHYRLLCARLAERLDAGAVVEPAARFRVGALVVALGVARVEQARG